MPELENRLYTARQQFQAQWNRDARPKKHPNPSASNPRSEGKVGSNTTASSLGFQSREHRAARKAPPPMTIFTVAPLWLPVPLVTLSILILMAAFAILYFPVLTSSLLITGSGSF